MTDIFTATYGTRIRSRGFPHPIEVDDPSFGWQPIEHYVGGSMMDNAMAEWYQHRRDQELGRWRDPENPDAVVYRSGPNSVRVLLEADGASFHRRRDGDPNQYGMDTAARYFAANPEPKPWHDAKPGEVWVLKIEGVPAAIPATVDRSPEFRTVLGDYFSLDDPRITAGQKIWPTGNPQQDPVESATRKESDDE